MEGLVLFVVALAVVVLFLILATHRRAPTRPERVIVEPLGWLIDHWVFARSFGQTAKVAQMLELFRAAGLHTNRPLDTFLTTLEVDGKTVLNLVTGVSLLHQEPIGRIGEQRVVEHNRRYYSIMIGDVEDLAPHTTQPKRGSASVDVDECRRQSAMAAANGFICLTIAGSVIHKQKGAIAPAISHQLIGGIILEPNVHQPRVSLLRSFTSQPIFLSVLPTSFLAHLYARLWPTAIFKAVAAAKISEAPGPKEHEEALLAHPIIGEADQKFRHATLLFWQTLFSCRLISTNPEDTNLPVKPEQL